MEQVMERQGLVDRDTGLSVRPVVLAGGSGSRLWPMSRGAWPKQLLPLNSPDAMLVETVRRTRGQGFSAPLVICNEEYRFLVAELMKGSGTEPEAIILEPEGRNTAPAVAIAALMALRDDPAALILVMPADHMIGDVEAFRGAVAKAAILAASGHLVTFGITPDRPHTGYGYIRIGAELPHMAGAFGVDRFIEKPAKDAAERFVEDGHHLWNSGLFLFPAQLFVDELAKYEPAILETCREALAGLRQDLDFCRLDAAAFRRLPSISVDVAVMERTVAAAVVPVDMAWNDLGTWQALWELGAKDAAGNVCVGDVLVHDTAASYVRSESGRLVAVVGLQDVVVVATDDALLVSAKDGDAGIRQVLNQLAATQRPEHEFHTLVHRPWGTYRNVDSGDRFRVKQIVVKPGGTLSLQYHSHRAEHWVVVQGTARVTCGDRIFVLHENESTYIPIGAVHRLENPGKIPLRLIEVQSGAYLEEDDIVRIEDQYDRTPQRRSDG